jgi:sortase A
VQCCWLWAGSVDKTKIFNPKDVGAIFPAFLVSLGIVLILYAFLGVRELMPPQAEPIPLPKPAASASASPPVVLPESSPSHRPALYPIRPNIDDRIGTITFPSLNLSWTLFEGTNTEQLSKGVGHYVKSVLPGESDNAVLSGHRTTVFNRLGELKVKDLILVKTKAGTFTYQVRKFRIVERTNRTVIVPTKGAVLTLTTCYPFNNLGTTTKAFIVVADLVTEELTSK